MSGQAMWMDPETADSSPTDKKLDVRFKMGPLLDAEATEKAKAPKYKDVPFVSIAIPGDTTVRIERPVWDDPIESKSDTSRWPKEWAAFNAGNADAIQGTPLSDWSGITRSQVEELAYYRIRTLEQLAGLADTNCQKFLGGVALRQKAQEALAAKDGSAQKERDARYLAQENALQEMAAQLAELKRSNEKKPAK